MDTQGPMCKVKERSGVRDLHVSILLILKYKVEERCIKAYTVYTFAKYEFTCLTSLIIYYGHLCHENYYLSRIARERFLQLYKDKRFTFGSEVYFFPFKRIFESSFKRCQS